MNAGTFKVTTPTDREILLTRTFDAPRAAVFEAWTKPNTSNIGGTRAASRSPLAKSTFGQTGNSGGSMAPTVRNAHLEAPTLRSRLLNGSCSL
jgi:hypothetical protein